MIPKGTTVRVISRGPNQNRIGTVISHTAKRTRVELHARHDESAVERFFLCKNLVPLDDSETIIEDCKVTSTMPMDISSCDLPETVQSTSVEPTPSCRPITRSMAHPTEFPFMLGSHRVAHIKLQAPQQDDPVNRTLLGYLLGERIRKVEYEGPASRLADFYAQTQMESNGYQWELLASKVSQSDSLFHQRQYRPDLYYIIRSGPALATIDPQSFLSSLAHFESLSPTKAASRIELLLTPAVIANSQSTGGKTPMIVDLDKIGIKTETIEEHCHEGCGFCPRRLIEELLGKGIKGRRVNSIQVRMIVPHIGLVKGMLTVKDHIGTIQIPSSMIKVGPSKSPRGQSVLLVKQTFPSKLNLYVAKYLMHKTLSKTALDQLQKPISDMIVDVLLDSGVSKQAIVDYESRKMNGRRERQERNNSGQSPQEALGPTRSYHFADTFLVGAADPTPGACIPSGFVFIPGIPETIQFVLITRSPCMHKGDLLKLPVLQSKPESMTENDWRSLNSRGFGDVYFGQGVVPLPNLIADGDLDGDLYFVCWDEAIVDMVKLTDVHLLEQQLPSASKPSGRVPVFSSERWFSLMQATIADVGMNIKLSKATGYLYNAAKKQKKPRGGSAQDFLDLSNAYKQSLDFKKHRGKIILPSHLAVLVKDKDVRGLLGRSD